MQTSTKIWFITGISSGLGQALTECVMANGDFVVGTFRQPKAVEAFNQTNADKGRAYVLDVTNPVQITEVSRQVMDAFGRIDVLVNNAGFGFAGAIEEASPAEVQAVFDANFYGALHVTQAFLPHFRRQRSGHIVQISSQAGVKATPGFGIYNASKFALEGFSEALAAEIAPLGIHLTLVEPGPFRTNFAGGSFRQAETQIADYHATAGLFRERMAQVNGNQEGDPQKAAAAIYQLVQAPHPPLRLPLGKTVIANLLSKLESVRTDVEKGRAIADGAVFD